MLKRFQEFSPERMPNILFTKEPIPVWIKDCVWLVTNRRCYGGSFVAMSVIMLSLISSKENGNACEIKNIFNQDIFEVAFGEKGGFELVNLILNGLVIMKTGTKKVMKN